MLASEYTFRLKMVDQMKSMQQNQNQDHSTFAEFKRVTILMK